MKDTINYMMYPNFKDVTIGKYAFYNQWNLVIVVFIDLPNMALSSPTNFWLCLAGLKD